MAKPELGTKRLCGSCGAKFYDLSKDPIICPKCGTVFDGRAGGARPRRRGRRGRRGGRSRGRRAPRRPRRPRPRCRRPPDAEFVSLEDADAEAQGKKAAGEAAEGDDEIEIEETEEAPFIEEQEEGDDDVTDIIGEGREDEEET